MLTGKCKEDFESYLLKNIYEHHYKGEDIYNHPKDQYFELFYSLPFSMQYGVYVDFFDSVGKDVVKIEQFFRMVSPKPTRNEARIKAIEKANEIYNSTHD